jgi:outer membrane protein assembly factor BamB
MKFTKLVILLAVTMFALSACSGRNLTPTSWPGLAVDGDRLLVAFDAHIYAVDPAVDTTNTYSWRFPAEPDRSVTFFAAPTDLGDGRWAAGTYSNALYALTATERGASTDWIHTEATNRYIGSPAVTSHGVFAPNADGQLYAVDFDGQELWPPFAAQEPQWVKPATDGQTLFVPSLDHNLYALDAATGQNVWSEPVDLGGAILGTPAFDPETGLVLVGSLSNTLFAIDAATGRIVWDFSTEAWVWGGPAVRDGLAYFGDVAGNLYAVNLRDGSEAWTRPLEGGVYGTPLLLDERLVIGTDTGNVYSYSFDGAEDWSKSINGKMYGGPVFVADLIIFAILDGDHVLTGYDSSGLVQFQWTIPEE